METFHKAVAVVTGGASGIGRGIATELARRGADVAIADVHEERLRETAEFLRSLGVRAVAACCDVTKDSDVEAFRDMVERELGPVDVLCNNAGVAVMGPPERVLMEDWEWILQVNVLGAVRGVRAFVPGMLDRRRGYLVNTSSIAGMWAYTWSMAPYITSKFAVFGLTEALARRLMPFGIGVSVLCPGSTTTNLGETARISGVPEAVLPAWRYLRSPDEDQSVTADDIGRMVADGILARRFAIFTHPGDEERFRTWRLDIDKSLEAAIEDSPPPPWIP
jgi:NAD(P)-dependent dehydrogenase (short-subunit alcohol dehydrogenase family)